MAATIGTSTFSYATSPSASPMIGFAPSDGSAIVLYHNGSAPQLATAQSPYTTWSKQTIGAATSRDMLALRVNADDSVDVMVCSPSNDAYYFKYTRSGNTWNNVGSFNVVSGAASTTTGAQAGQFHTDPQNRLWWVASDATLATRHLFADYTTNPTASWTHSLNVTISGVYYGLPFSAIIGNYLVVVYQNGSGDFLYQRLDVSGATLGAWSTAAALGVSDVATSVQGDFASLGGGKGMLVYAGANGIKAYSYDASTNTWASSATLSASASDRHPSIVPDGAGNAYAIWSQLVSGSNYAIVTKAYNGSAWDTSATTLEASAAGLSWPTAVYHSGKLGLIYTGLTASPYNVLFDDVTAPTIGGGGGTPQAISGSASATASVSLSLTVQKAISGASSLVSSAALGLTVTKRIAGAADSSASASLDLTVVSTGISGSASAESTAALTLTVEKRIAGAVAAGTIADLDTTVRKLIAGAAAAQSTASLDLSGTTTISGHVAASTAASLSLTVTKRIAGSAQATTTAALRLNVVESNYREPTAVIAFEATSEVTVDLDPAPTVTVEFVPEPEGTIE